MLGFKGYWANAYVSNVYEVCLYVCLLCVFVLCVCVCEKHLIVTKVWYFISTRKVQAEKYR